MSRKIVLLWVVVLLLAGCQSQTRIDSDPPIMLTVEPRPAPDTVLPVLGGEETTLQAWKGTGIVLNFWATWCGPCREEMPLLVEYANSHPEIAVIGVNSQEDAETAQAFVEEYGISFPILLDERGVMGNRLQLQALPMTVFIGPDGKLRGRHVGQLTPALLDAWLPALTSSDE
ncbi:MAG: TlpA family protein disulfide reductase [Anaerolineales bacterium]|nr:TlpA family protein disulfide reductase [Anaerolineales bacterium]MCB9127520.1 TlpA family protein disulfide reductase [Ardenticatenales bacterium]